MPPVIDANVILRHLLGDHRTHSPRATALLARVERGEITVRLVDTAVFEAVFVLERTYRQARETIADVLLSLIGHTNVRVDFPERLRRAFDLYVENRMSFGDAYLAAAAMESSPAEVISFDRDFGRVPGLARIEP